MSSSISKNKNFERDCEKYKKFIKECTNNDLKLRAESLYNQFIAQARELDYFFDNIVVTDVKTFMPQHHQHGQKLREIRYQLESLVNQA